MVKRSKRRASKPQAHANSDEEIAAADMPEQVELNLPPASPSPTRPKSARVQARRDANPERAQAFQRLKDAISAGDFDTDFENSDLEGGEDQKPKTRTRGAKPKQSQQQTPRRRSLRGRQAHEGHDDNEANEAADGELETTGAELDERQLKISERKLILQLNTRGLGAGGSNKSALQLEDIDWSEFDPETINAILARREELRKRRRRDAVEAVDGDETAPLHTAAVGQATLPAGESDIVDDYRFALPETAEMEPIAEVEEPVVGDSQVAFGGYDEDDSSAFFAPAELVRTSADGMDVDAEGDQAQLDYLFSQAAEMTAQTPSASLLLPPRPLARRQDISESVGTYGTTEIPPAVLHALRPQMAMLRGSADGQPGGISDMRLVLQMELKREEDLLKDLRAEIVDKISKLATEEKLLRMVVKHDFELGGDDLDEDTNAPETTFGGFGEVDTVLAPPQSGGMDLAEDMHHDDDSDDGSDSGDSISGMSSSTSDDEVQDDEVARGALNRMLDQYLPPTNAE
ncbi:hypothetical protein GGF42_001657 [Coemansia sp. RSA 2424]|nr:hypothetical protein GGF42_001657 [Coemansia sp. RSA 2424]